MAGVAVIFGWLAAHAAQDLDEAKVDSLSVPMDVLGEMTAGASSRLARLERAVSRIEQREALLGRSLPRRWSVLLDRYTLAVDEAGPSAPLAHTRLGWLYLERDPQWATFQLVEALEEAPMGPHADWAHLALGKLLFERADLVRAGGHYDHVVHAEGMLAPFAAFERGQVSFHRGDFDGAVEDFVYAARAGLAPLRSEAVFELAQTLVASDEFTAAAQFERACGEDTDCVKAAWARWASERGTLGFSD